MIKLKLDPRNIGQVLACCGIFELCEFKSPGSESYFKKQIGETDFCLETPLSLSDCISAVKRASVSLRPDDISHIKKPKGLVPLDICTKWGKIRLNWWLNPTLTKKSEFKTWGGSVTPSNLIERMIEKLPLSSSVDESVLMTYQRKLDSRLGFDTVLKTEREIGFFPSARQKRSPIGKMKFAANPIVELLAAIAFQTFRPKSVDRNKYEYGLWGWSLPLTVARLAFACKLPVGEVGKFRTTLIRRGSAKGFKHAWDVKEFDK